MCPLYVKGLIGPGDRKSVQPMAERLAPGDYDQLHHFVAAGVWDAPLETELLVQADKLVGGSDAVMVIDDTAVLCSALERLSNAISGSCRAYQCRRLSRRLQLVRCSRRRQSRMPRSALRRHHLTADFAGLMILRVHVDVPLAGGKLLRLLGGQCGFSASACSRRNTDRAVVILPAYQKKSDAGFNSNRTGALRGDGHEKVDRHAALLFPSPSQPERWGNKLPRP